MNGDGGNTLGRTLRAAMLTLGAILAAADPVRADDTQLGRWWADFGLGYGNMSASPGAASSGGGVWLDAQVGRRIDRHWLAGVDIGGLGLHPSGGNYDSNTSSSSIYGESLTNVFLVVQYEPRVDHGWFFGAGGGEVLYGNQALESRTNTVRSGGGRGGLGRIGYDWPLPAPRGHVEAVLSYEVGNVSLNAPLAGAFSYSIIAAGLHVAYH